MCMCICMCMCMCMCMRQAVKRILSILIYTRGGKMYCPLHMRANLWNPFVTKRRQFVHLFTVQCEPLLTGLDTVYMFE